jgi:hypothetical protein
LIASGRPLLLVLFVLTLPLVTPAIRGADEIEHFSYLRSLVFDHDLEFGNEYAHFYERDPAGLSGFKATFLDLREPTGRHINFAPLGSALLWSPFYLLAHLGVMVARAAGSAVAADGFSRPYAAAVCYGSAVYGGAALMLMHDGLRRFGSFSEPAASWTAAALWLGSPVLYYVTLAPAFAHAVSLFAVALLVWTWLHARQRGYAGLAPLAMGAAGGLAALVREQDGLFLALPASELIWRAAARRDPGALRALAIMTVTAVVLFTPQLLAYHAVAGGWGPSRLVARKMNFASPHFAQVLFDPGHGLFLWSPLLLLAAAGMLFALRARREAVLALLTLGFVLQVWINGSVESWTQAGAFGARRFVSSVVALAWGLAWVVTRGLERLGRRAVAVGLALFAWWNLSLMVQFGLRLMDRQRLTWPRVAVNQIAEVPPRLGRVAWLFFTDRERLRGEGP